MSGTVDGKSLNMTPSKFHYNRGCCHSKHTRNCLVTTGILGCSLLVLGLFVFTLAPSFLSSKILESLALAPESARLASWLVPPVEAYMTCYVFNLTNPEDVLNGSKPVLEEVGPFVYRAVTVKDSIDLETGNSTMNYNSDGSTLTYRSRKFYYPVSGNPDTTFITVPNIPLITALSSIRNEGVLKGGKVEVILATGLGKPFINVSFSGLLWGYKDELPCLKQSRPSECPPAVGEIDIFSEDEDEDWDNWKRKKRSVESETDEVETKSLNLKLSPPVVDDLRSLNFSMIEKQKAEYVECDCKWGLFRDSNVTLRKPITIHHGMEDVSKKGWVNMYDDKTTFGWWKENTTCNEVGGQDASTLPPLVSKSEDIDMFISLMCRKINLQFEKITIHSQLSSYRFIPPPNVFGSHIDADPLKVNPVNSCYCRQSEGFSCLKSGVLNLAPCKVTPDLPNGAPIALSFPHFYQADPSYLEAVEGLKPNKSLHQFYMDVEPTLGFPLAIRPRFQLNVVIRNDPDIDIMSKFPEELVFPILWAQDGFSEPSPNMASAISFGLFALNQLPLISGVVLLVLGGVMVLIAVVWWGYWAKRKFKEEEIPLN